MHRRCNPFILGYFVTKTRRSVKGTEQKRGKLEYPKESTELPGIGTKLRFTHDKTKTGQTRLHCGPPGSGKVLELGNKGNLLECIELVVITDVHLSGGGG